MILLGVAEDVLRRSLAPVAVALTLALSTSCQESSASATSTRNETAPTTQCGSKGAPECPTQQWMKATLQAYLRTRDFARLETSFTALAERAPEGYEGWGRMAEDGARAARAADEGKVRATCQECHDRHRSRFREQLRTAQLL
jgi:hypothetical protein